MSVLSKLVTVLNFCTTCGHSKPKRGCKCCGKQHRHGKKRS